MSYIERRLSYTESETSLQKTIHEVELLDCTLPAVILGEPGMGKSAILRSLAARDPKYEIISALKLKRRHAPVSALHPLVPRQRLAQRRQAVDRRGLWTRADRVSPGSADTRGRDRISHRPPRRRGRA